jgi:3-methyladenine DNA glycosylase/8-oxoguanine DNA glycosylase
VPYGKLAAPGPGGALVIEVEPRSPYRLPRRRWPDGVARTRDGVYERFLHVDGAPVLIRAWESARTGRVSIAAMPVPPAWLEVRRLGGRSAGVDELEAALDCGRRALGVDDDLSEFHARFKRDPLLGPLIRRMPWLRPRRTAQLWEAIAWAVTEQLIEAREAHRIQRRIVGRWGSKLRLPGVGRPLQDVPGAAVIADLAPAELAALDLAPKRAIALIKVAREVASGRCDLSSRDGDHRLGMISNIGPWTLQCLGQSGRGDLDSLPAGDLAYVKLIGRLAGMERRATVAEVEEFYAPYAPYRGIAGLLTLSGLGHRVAQGKPLRYHPASPELEAA